MKEYNKYAYAHKSNRKIVVFQTSNILSNFLKAITQSN